jgi:hypothetical protein
MPLRSSDGYADAEALTDELIGLRRSAKHLEGARLIRAAHRWEFNGRHNVNPQG